MSLPSTAFFIRDEKIVAAVFVNCGWSIHPDNIMRCFGEVLSDAMMIHNKIFSPKMVTWPESVPEMCMFFTEDKSDLPNFTHLWLYDQMIPRSVVDGVVFDKSISTEEFEKMFLSFSASTINIDDLVEAALEEKRHYEFWGDEE